MKKISLLLLLLIICESHLLAQDEARDLRYNKKGSWVWVSLTNGAVLGKGLLWKVTEDTLEFASLEYKNKNHNLEEVPTLKLHYSEIKELKTTPRAEIKKGMLAGAAIGFASGLAAGIATTENPDPYTKTETSPEFCLLFFCVPASTYEVEVDEPRDAGTVVIKTLILTGVGTLVGGILGNSASIEEITEGSKEKYLSLVPELQKQAFWGSVEGKVKEKN